MTLIIIWTVLSVIVVFDVKENRIPNKAVLVLFLCIFTHLSVVSGSALNIASDHWLGLLAGFAACFVLYVIKAMGAGDVKLIAVLSFFVGLSQLSALYVAIIFCGLFTTMLYVLQAVAKSNLSAQAMARTYAVTNIYGRLNRSQKTQPIVFKAPFAPAIVMGLLVLSYLS